MPYIYSHFVIGDPCEAPPYAPTLYKREMSQSLVIGIIAAASIICLSFIIILYVYLTFLCPSSCWSNFLIRIFYPNVLRKAFSCTSSPRAPRPSRSPRVRAAPSEEDLETQIANRRAQDHQETVEQLGFDPDFDPDEYVAPSNEENCIDSRVFERQSPSVPFRRVKRRIATPGEPIECSVCMCEVEDEERVRLLSCKHVFHVTCIDPWVLQKNSVCPLCRRNLIG